MTDKWPGIWPIDCFPNTNRNGTNGEPKISNAILVLPESSPRSEVIENHSSIKSPVGEIIANGKNFEEGKAHQSFSDRKDGLFKLNLEFYANLN